MGYTKQYPYANGQRWYVELVVHGKEKYNPIKAEKEYLIYDEDYINEYHSFAGCYLDLIKEEAAYERSPQGQIDILRDEIIELNRDLQSTRRFYAKSKQCSSEETTKFYLEHGEWLKQLIANKQREIIKIMTGRK